MTFQYFFSLEHGSKPRWSSPPSNIFIKSNRSAFPPHPFPFDFHLARHGLEITSAYKCVSEIAKTTRSHFQNDRNTNSVILIIPSFYLNGRAARGVFFSSGKDEGTFCLHEDTNDRRIMRTGIRLENAPLVCYFACYW